MNFLQADWFQQLDIFFSKKKLQIIFFIDKYPEDPKTFLSPITNIKVVFLPPNATSKLQLLCRKGSVQRFLRDTECTDSTHLNIFNSMKSISAASDEIKSEIIRNCFWKSGFSVRMDLAETENPPLESIAIRKSRRKNL